MPSSQFGLTAGYPIDTYHPSIQMGGYRRKRNQLFNEFFNVSKICLLAVFACTISVCAEVEAQRSRFEDFFSSQTTGIPAPARTLQGIPGGLPSSSSIITTPSRHLTSPATFRQTSAPTLVQNPVLTTPNLTQPNFDPFQLQSQPFPIFPQATQPPVQNFSQPNLPTQQFVQPQFNNQPFGVPQYGSPRSPYQGTGTNWLPSVNWPQDTWQSFKTDFLPRVMEHPRGRQTYLAGNNGNELGINDIEIATTVNRANFWNGPTALKISPGFIFHYWDGPDSTVYPLFDLPPQAFSAYLSLDHITDPSKVSGLETNLTIGYYSDFDNTSSDALRATGKLLGWYRLNCYTVGKLGVEYFDRVDVKLLPAVGVYMTPTPDMKFDLYFPKSKLAHRIPNINDFEAWAYVGGEYGGGSWAIMRRDGSTDQVDINDVRAYIGIEWMGPRRVTGFFEFGYVFDRSILYRSDAMTSLDLQDALMIRSGFSF